MHRQGHLGPTDLSSPSSAPRDPCSVQISLLVSVRVECLRRTTASTQSKLDDTV